MSLNIKNERVHDLAREAARLSGTSQTSAVEAALERYIGALKSQREMQGERGDPEALLAWRLRAFRAALAETDGRLDTEELYDETGLPV